MNDEYIGDGVYASFDGYQIWLAVNHHETRVVALDPQVFEALIGYAQRLGDDQFRFLVRPKTSAAKD